MANSRDFEELLYTWRSWRDNIGHEIRPKYVKYMELVNEAAMAIGNLPEFYFVFKPKSIF